MNNQLVKTLEAPQPVTHIMDLPNEILEIIVPDLEPKTISTLKLVNRRWYSLLANDRYYLHFIKYPLKYMLCWMKNENSSGRKVTEAIYNEEIGKWKGYLTLEKLHLENWRGGRISRCEKIPLPPLRSGESRYMKYCGHYMAKIWEDLIDEDGEHWILHLNPDGHAVLMNVTNEPRTFIENGITATSAILLYGQVMCDNYLTGKIVVYDIVTSGDKISMKFKYEFPIDNDNGKFWCVSKSHKANIMVSVCRHVGFDGLLHFRDLTTGNVLEDVNLWDYECLTSFFNDPSDMAADIHDNDMDFPYTMIEISKKSLENVVVAIIFNLKKMKPTSFLKIQAECIKEGCISCNKTYILSRGIVDSIDTDFVHSLPFDDCAELKVPKTLYSSTSSEGSFELLRFNHEKIFLIRFSEQSSTVSIMSLNNPEINMKVTLYGIGPYSEINFIGPDVLAVSSRNEQLKMFKITKEDQQIISKGFIDLEKTFCDHEINFQLPRPVVDSKDFSKIILYDDEFKYNDFLAVLYL